MSSSSVSGLEEAGPITRVIYKVKEQIMSSSSETSHEPPMSDWSSLEILKQERNKKKLLYEQSLYSPESGEICAKYISQSESGVLPEFYYPAASDPGIKEAIFAKMPTITFPSDGQDLYLTLCKEINTCPVRLFHRGLLTTCINLSYYGVSSLGIRPMARALQYNKYVKKFNLTDNFLDNDACYHLGLMLSVNVTLEELNMAGCRIGPAGLRRLGNWLHINRGLNALNLSGNNIGEEGGALFAQMIMNGVTIKRLNFSKNGLGKETASALADVFLFVDNITHLDLSMNDLYKSPSVTVKMLDSIAFSNVLEKFNLAWNTLQGARLASSIRNLMMIPTLKKLNLSNNRFSGEAIEIIVSDLARAKKLTTLDLSFNPLTPGDAQLALEQMLTPLVKLENLLMDNVVVDKYFLIVLDNVRKLRCRKKSVVTFDKVLENGPINGAKRELVLKRADNLWNLNKKDKADVAQFFMSLYKERANIEVQELVDRAAAEHITLTDDLITELVEVFSGPDSEKGTLISVKSVCEFMPCMGPFKKVPSSQKSKQGNSKTEPTPINGIKKL